MQLRCISDQYITLLKKQKHQESVLRSIETSLRFSGDALTIDGISTSMFGGAKYMCNDIMQTIIPKKSCNNPNREIGRSLMIKN